MARHKSKEDFGFILHHINYLESSLIVYALSQHQGVVSLLAKGAKRHYSQLRGVLLPFHQLHLFYGGSSAIKLLKKVEWVGGARLPVQYLHLAYYLNELVLKFCPLDLPCVDIFLLYQRTLQILSKAPSSYWVRVFEYKMLQYSGLLESCVHLQPAQHYGISHQGFSAMDNGIVTELWQFLEAEQMPNRALSAVTKKTLKNNLQSTISHHLHGRALKTRLTFHN